MRVASVTGSWWRRRAAWTWARASAATARSGTSSSLLPLLRQGLVRPPLSSPCYGHACVYPSSALDTLASHRVSHRVSFSHCGSYCVFPLALRYLLQQMRRALSEPAAGGGDRFIMWMDADAVVVEFQVLRGPTSLWARVSDSQLRVESSRASPPQIQREDGLAPSTATSITNLAAVGCFFNEVAAFQPVGWSSRQRRVGG
jgi:hypothetical protein